jgi:hypothetical protein
VWLCGKNSVLSIVGQLALKEGNFMKRSLMIVLIVILHSLVGNAQHESVLDEATLDNLTLSLERSIPLQPGQTHQFALYTFECCVFLKPVKARVSWSVEPKVGAHIDSQSGLFTVDKATPNGSVFTVSANVENGRKILTTKVHIFTPEANPLVGRCREKAQTRCDVEEVTVPDLHIEELEFRADGTFSVTWVPFEIYKDYWGAYSYDLKQGTIKFVVEHGNYVPSDIDGNGTFEISQSGQLTLKDIWLGSKKSEDKPAVCKIIFSRY